MANKDPRKNLFHYIFLCSIVSRWPCKNLLTKCLLFLLCLGIAYLPSLVQNDSYVILPHCLYNFHAYVNYPCALLKFYFLPLICSMSDYSTSQKNYKGKGKVPHLQRLHGIKVFQNVKFYVWKINYIVTFPYGNRNSYTYIIYKMYTCLHFSL